MHEGHFFAASLIGLVLLATGWVQGLVRQRIAAHLIPNYQKRLQG